MKKEGRFKEAVNKILDVFQCPIGWEWQYHKYYFSKQEVIRYGIKSLLIVWVVAYCFYHSWLVSLILSPAAILLMNSKRNECKMLRLNNLNLQFKDGLSFVSSAINAGYSIENAFKEATKEVVDLYGENADISREFTTFSRKLDMNMSVQDLVKDFGERSGSSDIKGFGENLRVVKKTGGDLALVIGSTSKAISEKQQITRDIETMVAAKRMEQNIMTAVPICIIGFVNISSPGFLDCMYQSAFGVIVMTICLIAYYGAYMLSRRILNIEV